MMKKIMLMIASAILMFTGCAEAQTGGIKFSKDTFADVQKEALKEDKLVFVDIYAAWCPPCKYLSSKIFPTKVVGDYMNATFINAKVEGDKDVGKEIAKKYQVTGFPTMLILNGKGEVLSRMVGIGGMRTPEDFVKTIKAEIVKINAKK